MQPPATVTLPPKGRVFRHRDRVTLADVSPAGRARLDALARWLQDAAYDDSRDSGLDGGGVWIVRRLALRVRRFPRLLEEIEVATFCSGAAPLWAERSSLVSAAASRPSRRSRSGCTCSPTGRVRSRSRPGFHAHLRAVGDGPPRARAAAPPAGAAGGGAARPWRFRGADLDLAGHVNNAVYWEALEDELVAREPAAGLAAEIEHRAPAGAGAATVLSHGPLRWITDPRASWSRRSRHRSP